jgi:molecular chaperone GrpE (heat shock protein)
MSNKELKEKLKQAKKENESKTESKKQSDLNLELEKLQKAYQEQSEIAIKAQRDYINLKFDFDRFQKQIQEKEKDQETISLISSVKKFLPFVEDLRKSLENIPKEKTSEPLAQ